MPQHSKAQWAKLKVGIMALVALVLLGILVFLLTGSQHPFASRDTVYTYMQDSAALTENSAVRLNGISVGKVSSIALSGSNDPRRVIRMDLQIEQRYLSQIPIDSTAKIGAENLLGTKYINITKGRNPVAVKPGGEIKSEEVADFNDVISQGNSLLVQLASILTRVDAVVHQVEVGKGSIGKLLVDEEMYNRLLATVNEVQNLAAALNSDKGTIGKLLYRDDIYNDLRGSIARMDNLLQQLQQGQGTAGRLLKDPALYDEAHKTILDIRKMLAGVDAGKGTLGKLLKSDDLHNDIVATIRKIDTMLDKINSGQGTLGQLIVNPSLYDALNGSTRELHELLKDFRANPKKFLHIKLGLF
jgi:phospholipid/cholesterol/gamma-HCH transport system substrate-binding protein